MDAARKGELAAWARELSPVGSAVVVATHDVEFAARFADRVVLMGDGVVIADGDVDDVLTGGWYFATEVARILGGGGAVTPEQGAERLRGAVRITEVGR
jgi:energy-coupling factor transport system ATP-binding protein